MLYEDPYAEVRFPDEVSKMFAEIVCEDEASYEVFIYIAKQFHKNQPTTTQEIANNIKLHRKVKKGKSKIRFEVELENIDRKHVQRIIERFHFMSLVYYKYELPHKRILLTQRGVDVLLKIQDLHKTNKSEGN